MAPSQVVESHWDRMTPHGRFFCPFSEIACIRPVGFQPPRPDPLLKVRRICKNDRLGHDGPLSDAIPLPAGSALARRGSATIAAASITALFSFNTAARTVRHARRVICPICRPNDLPNHFMPD